MRERFELFRGATRNFQNHGDWRNLIAGVAPLWRLRGNGGDGLQTDLQGRERKPSGVIYFEIRKNVEPRAVSRFAGGEILL